MQYSRETYEINKICRCCLKNIGEMKPLYGFSLDEMLRTVASLQVEPNDGLPELLCFQCVLQLSRAFRFREQCRKSNTTIREYIRNTENKLKDGCEAVLDGGVFQSMSSVFHIVNENLNPPTVTLTDKSGQNKCQVLCEDDYDCISIIQDGDDCEIAVEKEENILQNMHVTFTNTELKCGICDKQFSGRKQLVRHIKTHDDNKPYKCSECDKTFAESCNLKKHLLTHTGELRNSTSKSLLCSICGNSFKYSSSLSKHMKFHTGKNLLYCPQCPKYYAEKSALEIHMRCHTGDRPHACHHCDRRFTQACNLKKHLRSHSGQRPFKCPICERTFVERDYVTIHMQTHSSEKKALCSVCGKQFANSKTLDAHMRTHAEKRLYICGFEDCNKTFTRLDSVLVHRRIHSGEKPYSCNICTHSFTTSTQLSNHSRTHTGEKPFACELCLKRFASKNSLRIHSNKHNENQSTEITNIQEQVPFDQELPDFQEETITEQMLQESVLLFKINEHGELVPETEGIGASVANRSTVVNTYMN